MITIQFLAEWALRSSILIAGGALLIWVLRVKDPAIRLASWTAILCGSLAMPALSVALPRVSFAPRVAAGPVATAFTGLSETKLVRDRTLVGASVPPSAIFNWPRAIVTAYALIAGVLLLRLGVGLALSHRLLRRTRAAGLETKDGIEIRESDEVTSPVALGIVRPVIVLPADWRDWNSAKLDAVLAHERSHIQRHDPAVQALSMIHRALLWYSPLSWILDRYIVRSSEEASDDAAVVATNDREAYAEVLLDFIRRSGRGVQWGVSMARYGRPDKRIGRVLDLTELSEGMTRRGWAAILIITAPLACLVAAAHPQTARAQAGGPPQINFESATDGYLIHRGGRAQDSTSLMDVGGIDFQDKSYVLNGRFRDFALVHRAGKNYLITDEEMMRRVLKAVDDQAACRFQMQEAAGLVDETRKALTACRISDAEIAAARKKLRDSRAAAKLQPTDSVVEIVTGSRLWDVFDLGISKGLTRPVEP